MKTKWQKPELLVLYRGRPEENLLTATYCKYQPLNKNGADNAAGQICVHEHGRNEGGVACEIYATS